MTETSRVPVVSHGDEYVSWNETWDERIERRAKEETKLLTEAKKLAEKFGLELLEARKILLSID